MEPVLGLLIFGASIHPWDDEGVKRVTNPGIGLMVHEAQVQYGMGMFTNSLDQDSLFLSIGYDWEATEHVGATVNVAALTGYYVAPVVVSPMVTVYAQKGPARLHAAVMPEAVAIFLEWRL